MKSLRPILWMLAIVLAIPFSGLAESDPNVLAVEQWYVSSLAKVEGPATDLRTKYLETLEAWKQKEQEKGNLSGVLAAQREIDSKGMAKAEDLAPFADLRRFRSIYDTNLAKIEASSIAERRNLGSQYRDRLQAQVERLTRESKLDQAVALSKKVADLEAKLATSSTAGPRGAGGEETVLWEFNGSASGKIVGRLDIQSAAGGFVLTSARGGTGRLESSPSFKPPFRVQARVATDSTNIRFYYNANILAIFNWEVNPLELRMHDPATGRNYGLAEKGEVAPNKMHDIEIDVRPDRVEVRVGKRRRGVINANIAAIEAPVGIGPALGSVVTVESMRVVPLAE